MNTSTGGSGLRELFEAVLERPPCEREAYLRAHCADAVLRARVAALLHADANIQDPLRTGWADRVAREMGDDSERPRLPPGGRIGPFEIVCLLGEGGFSTVFEGRRDVAGVVQRVAVKLLHRGLHAPDAKRRFEHERRALLQLRHPNITRMIEGGVTDAGLAYIALDLVEGVPITDYARSRGLGLSPRLRLFVDVCRAVEAAHRALIVHRDLKPTNVLVANDGTVHLLDFGIAKLLGGDADDDHTVVPAFTPSYAAPEQRSGGAITTAADVYSLGVLLDELLTGARRAPDDARTPSARVGDTPEPGALPAPPATTRKLLRGDLDTIVLKATAEEPARRYASAGALADDVERHLARQPVLAHPPSRWYRARKFIARHRGGVATTAAFLLAILASLGVALWQAKSAREQARIAQRESVRAQAEKQFIAGLFEPLRSGVQEGEVPSLRQLLDAGVAQLDERFAGDAAALADLSLLFSQVNTHIGEKQAAHDLAERAYTHARAAFGERDARTLVALGQRGRTAIQLDRYAEAEADLVRAVAGMQALGLRDDDYAYTLQDLSRVRAYSGRTREAIADGRAAYDILRESAAGRIELAQAMNNLGFAYNQAGDTEQGIQWQQRAVDWYVAHGLGENRSALIASANVAFGKSRLGRWREALSDLERLLPLERKVAGGSHDLWINTAQACSTAISLALSDKAETHCGDAVRYAEQEKGSASPRAITRAFLGRARVMQGRYAEARADLAQAERLFAGVEGDQGAYLRNIALDSAEMLRVENATHRFIAAVAPLVNAPGFDRERNAAPALARFALACIEASPAPDACRDDDAAARAEALLAAPARARHPIRLPATTALALRAVRLGDAPQAVERLEAALTATRPELGADHPWVAEAEAALAVAAAAAGRGDLARSAGEESARIARLLPQGHPLRERLSGMR